MQNTHTLNICYLSIPNFNLFIDLNYLNVLKMLKI